ncbi:hypothetical protein AALP_AA8G067300 [Arabis alpina]|uniref:TPX2 central domain-containing protein n=1 Tax=Arabis alpina TaxID=50452 RepID=A0A087G5F9_ARAAL|nr:hypothetical protein AALP_AA8G067300 [Arabis alpina]
MLDIAFELIGEATSNSLLMFCFCNLIIVMILTGSSKPGSMDSQDSTFTTSVSYNMCSITSHSHDSSDENDEEIIVAGVSSAKDESLIDDSSVSDQDEDRESIHCCDYDVEEDNDDDNDEDEEEDDYDDGEEVEEEESKEADVEDEGDDDLRKRALMMDPETTFGEDFSVEEFDIDFEFDAPKFYDFSKPQLDLETEETEHWFKSAGNYPPSPFTINLSPRYEEKHLKISKPISDKYNGFIHYNQTAKNVPKTNQNYKTKTFLRKNSTLTKPTASLLARQNKPLDIYSVQLLSRCQRSLGKFDDKISSLLLSMPQPQDTKRQKLETGFLRKASRLDQIHFLHKVPKKGSKVTVPKEPNLKTAQRAARHQFKTNSAPEQISKFSSNMNKTVQESSSTYLSKKNTSRSQDIQAFHLRTSLRAKERSSLQGKIAPSDDRIHSITSKSIGSRKCSKVKESCSLKTNCQVYESEISPLDSKKPSKCGEAIEIKHEINFPREFEVLEDTDFRDEPFIESLRKLCLNSDTDSAAVLLD